MALLTEELQNSRFMNKKTHTIKFRDWICKPTFAKYRADDSLCIRLIDHITFEPIATATVCLHVKPPSRYGPPLGCIWVKDYNENEGMTDALIKAGVIKEPSVSTVSSGHVKISAYRLTEEFKTAYDLKQITKP